MPPFIWTAFVKLDEWRNATCESGAGLIQGCRALSARGRLCSSSQAGRSINRHCFRLLTTLVVLLGVNLTLGRRPLTCDDFKA